MPGKYLLHSSGSQFHWDLKAGNGEKILSSERYTSKQGALNGIQSCRTNSPLDARYERRTASNGQGYFVLKGGNGEIIGTSETYASSSGVANGIASCKENGPTAVLEDKS